MVIDSAYVCKKTFSGKTYLIGMSFNLINRSTGEKATGNFNGMDKTDYPGDASVVCERKFTTGVVY